MKRQILNILESRQSVRDKVLIFSHYCNGMSISEIARATGKNARTNSRDIMYAFDRMEEHPLPFKDFQTVKKNNQPPIFEHKTYARAWIFWKDTNKAFLVPLPFLL